MSEEAVNVTKMRHSGRNTNPCFYSHNTAAGLCASSIHICHDLHSTCILGCKQAPCTHRCHTYLQDWRMWQLKSDTIH